MKMELIVSSEMSAIRTQTPGNYPKRYNLHLEHGESLRTRKLQLFEKKNAFFLRHCVLDVCARYCVTNDADALV